MTPAFELDPTDYHLRLLIGQMERDGRSEEAIDRAVRIASSCKPPVRTTGAHDSHPGDRRHLFRR